MSGLSDSLVGIDGLYSTGKVTVVTLDSISWTPLPALALASRSALLIQNQSSSGVAVLINYSNTAGAEGIKIEDRGFKSLAAKDTITVYGRMVSGSGTVAVEELA
jgi:hypothetical protein